MSGPSVVHLELRSILAAAGFADADFASLMKQKVKAQQLFMNGKLKLK